MNKTLITLALGLGTALAAQAKDIVDTANRYPARQGMDPGRERYLQKIDGMVFGDSREQGVIRGNQFLHEPLGFAISAPGKDWKLQNSAEALLVANPAGDAGVIMRLVTGAGGTHDEIIRKLVKPQSGRVERTTINGLQATHFAGTVANQQGQAASVAITLIAHNNQQFLLQQAAKNAQALNASRDGLRAVINSFHAITAEEKKLARPYVIRTQPLPPGRNFAALAKESPVNHHAEPQLRLLNGYYPGGEAPAGRVIKFINQ